MPLNHVNHNCWIGVFTPSDRPQSVRNGLVVLTFWWLLCDVALLVYFSVDVGTFVKGLSQIRTCITLTYRRFNRKIAIQ